MLRSGLVNSSMKLYSNINYIFIIWLVAVSSAAFVGFSTLPHSGNFGNNFWQSLGNWDGGHYTGIAKAGYSQKFQYAFFPLYPLIISAFNLATGNYYVAAVLISLVASFLGLHLLYRLVLIDFNKKIAQNSVLAFLFFPASFFLLTAYSEGLFFFLTVVTFYFLRQNKLFWAVLAAALVSATRLIGLAVVAGLLVEVGTRQGFNRKNWYLIFAFSGFLIYAIFLYTQTGDPFYFITAENHWQRTLAVPGVGFWEALKSVASHGFVNSPPNILFDLAFAVFGLGFAIRSFRFLPASFAVYSLLSVGLPLFTPTLSSMPRFLLPVFPIFILAALIKNQYISLVLQMISLLLLGVFTVLFINGYWVS